MSVRTISSVLMLLLSFVFWLWMVPQYVGRSLPPSVDQFLSQYETLGLLIGFVMIPALLGFLALLAIVSWLRLSSWILSREELEGLMARGIYGGSMGRFEKWLLDRLYAPR